MRIWVPIVSVSIVANVATYRLRAQHAILDWTTAFPRMYSKKTVKNFLTKATLPHKCKSLEKAAEKWRRDAEVSDYMRPVV